MSPRRLVLLSLLIVAMWLALFGDKTPSEPATGEVVEAAVPAGGRAASEPSSPPAREVRQAAAASVGGKRPATLEVAALIPRDELIPEAGAGQEHPDLFPALSWTPPPPKPPPLAKPPPPMAPPVPFTFLGKKLEGGQWEVYLGRGEELLIVREGMKLEGIYQVKNISPPTLTLVYLPLKQSQTISIGGAQ
jgi:hypothetical protein